jgi:microcin C transport system permease protein
MSLGLYFLKRVLMMIPTLLGITVLVFFIINLAPGGPIEQKIQQMRFSGAQGNGGGSPSATGNNHGVSEEIVQALKKQYGFDKPVHVRYWIWLKNLTKLDFGLSFTYEDPVIDVIVSKFPVSLQFGIISLILTYIVCIPLGLMKAVKKDSAFDNISSFILFVMYSVPPFMLGILLLVFFAGGTFFEIFPVGGFVSDEYDDFTFWQQVGDRIHHFVLPLVCYMIGSFTSLTQLMKNSLLEEISKDYIRTARSKGLDEFTIYLKHALRNALIPVATGIGHFLSIFFAGSLLIELIFELDGIGLLGYNSIMSRDYNVLMGLTFIQSLLMLIGNMISDFVYVLVDPRIDFS